MLLSAGFISLFSAPPGLWPRWGERHPASRASLFLLLVVWFTIYFESGVAKIASGDPQWRNLTAMDQYYQNGPLPTWIGWYAHHLPHAFHAVTSGLVLVLELVLIFAVFLPSPFRILLFFLITPWEMGIILTSNYAFLNYLVLLLGILLLDDKFLGRLLPKGAEACAVAESSSMVSAPAKPPSSWERNGRLYLQGFFLTWVFYATCVLLLSMIGGEVPLPTGPVRALAPFRIANDFGLFAVMTRDRFEIEFQGSRDGQAWIAYPFR